MITNVTSLNLKKGLSLCKSWHEKKKNHKTQLLIVELGKFDGMAGLLAATRGEDAGTMEQNRALLCGAEPFEMVKKPGGLCSSAEAWSPTCFAPSASLCSVRFQVDSNHS